MSEESATDRRADQLLRAFESQDCESAAEQALRYLEGGATLPEAARIHLERCLQDAPDASQSVLARARVLGSTLQELPELAHQLLHDERDLVRDAASDALAEIGAAAHAALSPLLADEDREVRWYVTEALAREHDEDAIPLLVEQLKDDDFSIRWVASNGLLDAGTASVVPVVRAIARDEPSLLFHNAARRVLARVSASHDVDDQLLELVTSLGRSTTMYQSQPLALDLLKRLLG